MGYYLDFTDKAKEDIAEHKQAGNKALLSKLLEEANLSSIFTFIP